MSASQIATSIAGAAIVPAVTGITLGMVGQRGFNRQNGRNQASALINVARNLGGSMGVALVQTVLAQRQQFHQSRLVEHIAPSDVGYQQTIDTMTRFFRAQGSNASDAASQAVAWVGQTLQHQVDLLAYIDVFRTLAIIGAIMVPVALSLRTIDLSAAPRH